MYDALITGYSDERHLLVEVKTDSEQPTCRLAVGQLLDYRSQLPDRARIGTRLTNRLLKRVRRGRNSCSSMRFQSP